MDISKSAECEKCNHKSIAREDEMLKSLNNRLNRMIGQLGGIQKMLDENRYCGDILIQIAAIESALQNFGYIILKDHMESCVTEKIKIGDEKIIDETMDLIKKLK